MTTNPSELPGLSNAPVDPEPELVLHHWGTQLPVENDTNSHEPASAEHTLQPHDLSQAEPSTSTKFTLASSSTEPPQQLRLEVAAHTDVGCVRTNNEDAFGYDQTLGLYILCDGMGGMASGEIASALAVSTAISTFASSAATSLSASTRLLEAVNMANQAVWQFGQQPGHRGMGTTLVAAAFDGHALLIVNVGDSRAYMLHDGHCMQLTVDHSYLNELIRTGTIAVEDAHKADLKGMESVITRAIGSAAQVEPDFFSVVPGPADLFLLASDGLTRYLNQEDILHVVSATDFASTPRALIEIAKQRGGQDNITCLLLRASQ
jgi:serine/threonine protein phosphatase PrpC